MVKQTKSRKTESIGKGKVTPVQIAFIVDRYLADNNFTNTRSSFRNEASDLLSRSPIQEAPRSLLSLGDILEEYIVLKEQKVILDQEKGCVEQEKFRVQNLLKGMQNVMNDYNIASTATPLTQTVVGNSAPVIRHIDPPTTSPAGLHVYKSSPAVMPASRTFNTPTNSKNLSTSMAINNPPTSKRKKSSNDGSDVSVTAKRSRSQASNKTLQVKDTNRLQQQSNTSGYSMRYSAVTASPRVNVPSGSSVQGSSVAKCLFNQPSQLPPSNLSSPNTPPQEMPFPSEKSASPPEITNASCSNNVSPQPMTSTNCTLFASETITVSPSKQMTYSVERNCRISSSSPIKTNISRLNKRDHVKGRLDFDGSDIAPSMDKPIPCEVTTSEMGKEVDHFDFGFPNFDNFGPDFNFSELLSELGLAGEDMSCSYQPVIDSSPGSFSGSQNTPEDATADANQVLSEFSSTVTEVLSEKNMNVPGPDSVTSMKSITKSIKILSPVKKQRSPSRDQENILLRNKLLRNTGMTNMAPVQELTSNRTYT